MAEDDAGTPGPAAECQFCPFCAGLAALRQARPEAVEHLVKAGAELFLAARALLEGVTEAAGAPGRGRHRPAPAPGDGRVAGNGLQRIDIG